MKTLPGRLVLLGHPVGHSRSPLLQNAALRAAGLELTYEAIDVAPGALPGILEDLRKASGAGNVTIPHKAAVAAACARLTRTAERAGAVNTFWCEGSDLVGDNTDVAGFNALASSVIGAEPRGFQVTLIGAGGAAAAVCTAVEQWQGSRIQVLARRPERAAALARRFPNLVHVATDPVGALEGADVVVNATPVGLSGEDKPVPVAMLPRNAAVMDLVYRAGGTPWVVAARAAGHRAADGTVMLLEQGAQAFRCWFGIEPDREAMRRAMVL